MVAAALLDNAAIAVAQPFGGVSRSGDMTSPRTIALGTVAALAVGAVPAVAATSTLTVHSIFSGGKKSFHTGAIAQVGGHGPKITKVCVRPAPIDRAECSSSKVFAPSATGTATITATYADGHTQTQHIHVSPGAGKLDGPVPVVGYTHCSPTVLYGGNDRKHHRLAGARGAMPTGTRVALYNRVGTGRLAWAYKTNANGFVKTSCIARAKG